MPPANTHPVSPAVIAGFGGFGGCVIGVIAVERCKRVLWRKGRKELALGHKMVQKTRQRCVKDELNGGFVDDLCPGADIPRRPGRAIHLFVHDQVVEPECNVLCSERRAVRPFVPFTQFESDLGEIVIPSPGLGDIRLHGLQIIVKTNELNLTPAETFGRVRFQSPRQIAHLAAIGPAGLVWQNHKRFCGQTLCNSRKRIIVHQP